MAIGINNFLQCFAYAIIVVMFLCSPGHSDQSPGCRKDCNCTSTPVEVGNCICPEYGIFLDSMLQDIVKLDIVFSQPVVIRAGNIQRFHRIWFLTISGMQFVEPGGFQGLETLDRLVLYDNYMRVLGTNMFTGLQRLTKLVAEGTTRNTIHALENGTFCNLTSLKHLDLKANAITALNPEHFRDLDNLDIFDISGNRLTKIKANTFVNSPLLTEIKLSRNQITEIHRNAFVGLMRLNNLDLDGNLIKGMPQPRFLLGSLQLPTDSHFKRVAISLDDNPLRCDCHLNWISSWLDNSQICNGFCDSPSRLEHKSLHDVYKDNLSQCLPNNTGRSVESGKQLELTCSFAGASWVIPDGRHFEEHGACDDPFYLTNRDSMVIWKTSPEHSGNYFCFSSDGAQAFLYQVNVTESGTSFTTAEWAGIFGAPGAFVLGILLMSIILLLKNKCQQHSHGNGHLPLNDSKGDSDNLLGPQGGNLDPVEVNPSGIPQGSEDFRNIIRKTYSLNPKVKNISISI
nr:reticulon-4 receptor-like 2 [Lytechinus pictus]